MPRKRTFHTFREAQKLGPYAEMPMLPEDIQVQVRLSRNDRDQPFFALFAKDTMLLSMSGAGKVAFRGTSIHDFSLEPGDCIYVPAGTPHRLLHEKESVVLRYVPQSPLVEGVAWFCEGCDKELYRQIWNTAECVSAQAHMGACIKFNADETLRTCKHCAQSHLPINLASFKWDEVAQQSRMP